jgi:hypothetical protein
MRLCISLLLFLALSFAETEAQQLLDGGQASAPVSRFASSGNIPSSRNSSPPRSPEFALNAFHELNLRQEKALVGFAANSLIQASLPSTSQQAELEVLMQYVAPGTLQFTQLRFAGDPFVKRNVIARMLQAEVDHVVKQEVRKLAITISNYSFRYQGENLLDGHPVHVYAVKPRHKTPGLFKGTVYLDLLTGSLLRAKGTVAKSPSFFIRRIEFVQDYADFEGFTLPVRLHSVIKARVLGKVVLDVSTQGYSVSTHGAVVRASVKVD